ncbi:hypothetical protein HaLaN_16637 [Haematococcus lacustris]|uniref:Uncharacterized protein n=1 Tax=Haematococcus lacustris TaxID=44745 RepID=A0A699ZJD7_HAELA|nr:hypothetical protein HaLaN_16637 [Haematococcus lacustris]
MVGCVMLNTVGGTYTLRLMGNELYPLVSGLSADRKAAYLDGVDPVRDEMQRARAMPCTAHIASVVCSSNTVPGLLHVMPSSDAQHTCERLASAD